MTRAFETENDAKKFSTKKRNQDRLHDLITAIEVPGQSTIDVIDVDGFAGLQARIKVGPLKYENSKPATHATQQPETNDVAGLGTRSCFHHDNPGQIPSDPRQWPFLCPPPYGRPLCSSMMVIIGSTCIGHLDTSCHHSIRR